VIRWCLSHRTITIVANVIFLLLTIPLLFKIGSQFMPPLYEGSSLYMPTALPGISISSAVNLMQKQDQIIRTFPRSKAYSALSDVQTAQPTTRRWICTTRRSCSSRGINGERA
jgi:Cu/Ag efflux pump CusA